MALSLPTLIAFLTFSGKPSYSLLVCQKLGWVLSSLALESSSISDSSSVSERFPCKSISYALMFVNDYLDSLSLSILSSFKVPSSIFSPIPNLDRILLADSECCVAGEDGEGGWSANITFRDLATGFKSVWLSSIASILI